MICVECNENVDDQEIVGCPYCGDDICIECYDDHFTEYHEEEEIDE